MLNLNWYLFIYIKSTALNLRSMGFNCIKAKLQKVMPSQDWMLKLLLYVVQ